MSPLLALLASPDASAPRGPEDHLVIWRLPVNAPNAQMAAQAILNHEVYARARAAGLYETRPLAEESALRRQISWLKLYGGLCQEGFPSDGPVAGYWMTVTRRLSDEGPAPGGGFTLPVNLTAQRLDEPHREPLAFAMSLDRSPEDFKAETQAYWDAEDLRAQLAPAPPSRKGASL